MILTWLGRIALDVAFLACVAGVVSQVLTLRGRRSRARLYGAVALGGMVGAVGVMQFALITHNFSLAYVSENNATFTPFLYSITGMWSALEGSLLLWALLLAMLLGFVGFTLLFFWLLRERYRLEVKRDVTSVSSLDEALALRRREGV